MDLNKLLEKRSKESGGDAGLKPQAISNVENTVRSLPVSSVREDDNQPRQEISQDGVEALAKSIDKKGLLQPIIVKPDGNEFLIVAGHRRYRAYLHLNKDTIPSIVLNRPLSEKDLTELALIENLQREDLNVLEIAQSLARLKDESGATQEHLAEITGYSQANISKYLRIYDVIKDDPRLQKKVKELGVKEAYESLAKKTPAESSQNTGSKKFQPFRLNLKKGNKNEIKSALKKLDEYRTYLSNLLNDL